MNKHILYLRHIGYCTQFNNCMETIKIKNITMKAVFDTIVSGLNNPQNNDFKDWRNDWPKNIQTNKY